MRKIKKIALINPRKKLQEQNPRVFDMFERNKSTLKLWYAPPLSLMIIASHTPSNIEITIFDEFLEEIDYEGNYDLVGITAMTHQATRAYEIAAVFKSKNIPVVMGGIHATVVPSEVLEHVDVVFRGESERLWPVFLQDFENGREKKVYMDDQPYDMTNSVIPRYDLFNYEKYKGLTNYFKFIPLQATRGCPHDCSFCVVSKFYGKKIRRKPVAQVVDEIKKIQALNYESAMMFVDDNLFVDHKYAKELLKALIPLRIKYFVQTDVKLADDPELLDLVYKSGCVMVLIGFESVDPDSLHGINSNNWKKAQLANYETVIQKIQEKGIVVYGAFIIGFKNDTMATFDTIKNFILKNKIAGQFTLLTPLPGSKIYDEMKQEGRLLKEVFWDNSSFFDLTIKHDYLDKDMAEQKIVLMHEEVYSEKNVTNRNLHMMNIYKNLPPRWEN